MRNATTSTFGSSFSRVLLDTEILSAAAAFSGMFGGLESPNETTRVKRQRAASIIGLSHSLVLGFLDGRTV